MADITLDQITSGSVGGTGAFDKLMLAVRAHLQEEFAAGRISASDYSTVLLGGLQTALGQAIQFVLSEQQADKQAELLSQQILTQVQQTALTQEQVTLTQEQAASQVKQTELLTEQILLAQKQVLQAQAQIDKLTEEVNLLAQKKLTEQAQINDTVNGVAVAGTIGKQKALYEAQTVGFSRDAEQKVAQQMIQFASVMHSANPDDLPTANMGFAPGDYRKVMEKLTSGVGVTLDPVP